MQSWILHQEPQQCHCALSRVQFLLIDLYDNQTYNRHGGHHALLYALTVSFQ